MNNKFKRMKLMLQGEGTLGQFGFYALGCTNVTVFNLSISNFHYNFCILKKHK